MADRRSRPSLADDNGWFRLPTEEIEALRREAEAAGRQLWNAGTRTGRSIIARTQKELEAIGAAELQRQELQRRQAEAAVNSVAGAFRSKPASRPPASAGRERPSAPPVRATAIPPQRSGFRPSVTPDRPSDEAAGVVREAGRQILAGINGGADAATLGLADKYQAADYAWKGLGEGDNLVDRYRSIRARQEAQDRYEAEHYATARTVGGVAGTIAAIAATGGLGAEVSAARLAPQASRAAGLGVRALRLRYGPVAAAGGAGSSASVIGQGLSDLASGRLSDVKTYAGAAVGGGVGGATTLYGGPRVGAIAESVATASARSASTGEPVSLRDIEDGVVAGVYFGRLGELGGINWADHLPSGFNKRDKRFSREKLGELMSELKSDTQGELTFDRQRRRPVEGGYTVVDQLTDLDTLIESKFGKSATLSNRQKAARRRYGDQYRVDHWLPADFGKLVGGTFGLTGGQAASREDRR